MIREICLSAVFCSASAFGFYLKKAAREEIFALESLVSGLLILEREIEYALLPLPRAIASVAEEAAPPFKKAFRRVADRLSGSEKIPFSEIWEEEMAALFLRCNFTREEKKILISLGGRLGRDDFSGQKKTIEHARQRLSEEVERRKESFERREKMYGRLGVLTGLLLFIVLI